MRSRRIVYLFSIWLVFVVSLATWWIIFSLDLIHKFSEKVPEIDLGRQKTMLVTEGAVLVLCLLFGGGALVYYSRREQKRMAEIQLFFSTFSHDLKTAISRLVLQGEHLAEQSPEAQDFHSNLMSLERQLENSLHLAQLEKRGLLKETLDLKNLISRLHTQWPELKIRLEGKGSLWADPVALESILKNLMSNSHLHAQADEILLKLEKSEDQGMLIFYSDNGMQKVDADAEILGKSFRPSQKGSGVGLYLVRRWMILQNGSVEFSTSEQGHLKVQLKFPGRGS